MPTGPAGYGRGTTREDVRAGQTSLRFHESRHGQDFLDFLRTNPPPTFAGKAGMTVAEFEKAMDDYGKAVKAYHAQMTQYSIKKSDCVGRPISAEGLRSVGLTATFCTDTGAP